MSEIHALPQRWQAKIRADAAGCWIWTGRLNSNGYGLTTVKSASRVAHRAIYEVLVGPIPAGLQLDHLCRVRRCVRPAHLDPVTQRINLLRGETLTSQAAAATHCPMGHEYAGANLYRRPNGARMCRACHRRRQVERRAADPEAARAAGRRYDKTYRDRKRA
jgi:hypothetical protein